MGSGLSTKRKIVATIDICSSSKILEDLTKWDNIKKWENILGWLRKYLEAKKDEYHYELYKFTGDGWIVIFDVQYHNTDIIRLLREILNEYRKKYYDEIRGLLDTPPDIDGLTFGLDEGELTHLKMGNRDEYVGLPINIACRLQGIIDDVDIKSGYRVFMSNRLYNSMKANLSDYAPLEGKRRLRNISGREVFTFHMLSISETALKIKEAYYGSHPSLKPVTEYIIRQISNDELDVIINNDLFGGYKDDPAQGKKKELRIKCIFREKEYELVIPENHYLHLPLPDWA